MEYSGLFSDAVDEGLSVLGQSPKKSIYEFLETDYGMERKDIPARFREFSSILLETVGPSSGDLLEFIIERFYSRLHLDAPMSTSLREAIEAVQSMLKDKQAQVRNEDSLTIFH